MRFFNYPRYCSEKEYKKTIGKVIKKYLPLLSSVYTFGGKITPGISDIDFIMVINEKTKRIPLNLRLFLLDKKSRYIVAHPFFFMGSKDMSDVSCIYPNTNIRLVAGKGGINRITKEESRFYWLVTSIDLIIRHFPKDYVIPLSKGRIDIRDMLLRLNALTISFDAIKRNNGRINPGWRIFDLDVKNLRKNWFRLDKNIRRKILVKLVKAAIYISVEVTEEFNRLLKKYVTVLGNRVIYNGLQNKAVFIKEWNKEKALKWIQKNKSYSLLPLEFSILLFEYSRHSGPISSYIRKNLRGNIYYEIRNKELIKKRIRILNNQAYLADKLKHSHFTAFIDFGYKSNSGLVNKLFNMIRKIKHRN